MKQITLATLAEATAQEVFDQVATHLLKQNEQSRSADDWCAYRGANGLMCAAGCLIADDEYKVAFDTGGNAPSKGWDSLIADGFVPRAHSELIQGLQHVHDCYPPDQWRSALARTASGFGLYATVLEKETMK